MTVLDLDFPVIAIRKAGMLVHAEPDGLTVWGADMVRNRDYEELRVIDSSLREYAVAEARVTGAASRLPSWLVPQTVHVDLQLDVVGQLSLDEAKDRIIAVLERAPEFWAETGDIEEMKNRIQTASTFPELVAATPA